MPPNVDIQVENQAPPIDGAENEGVAPQPNPPQVNGPNDPARGGRRPLNGRIAQRDIDLPAITSTVLGALFFPAISSIMGTILKLTLPSHLTSTTTTSKGIFWTTTEVSKGLLKEKWGRSIVGGCLFVVLKDAVVLYCKWKKARDFGKRKVLDFTGERVKSST
jgi:hypothetical protein